MKIYHFYFGILLTALFLLAGCYTQFNLVDRSERYDSYYYEGDTGDSVYADQYSADDYYYDPYYYDPYCNFYLGWNSWWLSPRWGWYVGFSPWYYPYGYYYSPYAYWWYNDYYPYYWYGAGYGYAYHRNYGKRSFNRRSPYSRSNERTGLHTPSERILTHSRIPVTSGGKTAMDSRRGTSPSIRNDREGYRDRTAVRRSPRQKVIRRSSTHSRPSYSGRSSGRSSSGSYRGRSSSGSSRSSGSNRSSGSSSSGRSRR